MVRSDASKRHDANSCGPAQCRIDASLPTGGRSGRHSKPSARNSITREARVQPATERELPTPREEGIAKPAEWGTPTWPVFLCASGERAAGVRPPLPIPPSQTFRGIMRDSVLKHWMRSGLVLVAGVAVAVGCGTKESTGPAADYTLSLAPAALTIVQGANGTATVTITRTNFTGAVTLSLGGAPTGVTGSFNPAAPTGTSATLTVSVGAAVAAGVYDLTVAGAGSAGNRSTPLTLTVNAAPDYALSVAPTALTIAQGANGTTTVTITRTSFTDAVTLSLGNAPTGVTGSFNPAAPTGTGSTLTLSVGAAVARGVYSLTVGGAGSPGTRSTPLTLTVSAEGSGVTVDAGGYHSCALMAGQAFCWGNNRGQVGDGTTPDRFVPTAVAGGLTFAALSAGDGASCGLTPTGAAYCWGFNNSGQLGDGTTTDRLSPTPVAGGLTFAMLSAGNNAAGGHTCGVTTSGAAYCWGRNGNGQLGDGTTTDRLVPTPIAGGVAFAAVITGGQHTCGVTTSGAAYCWGFNGAGGLGDGTTTQRLVPTVVAGGLTFATLSAGGAHTCGVTASGGVCCWGLNGNGQLGDGTVTNRLVPTPVAPPGSEPTPDYTLSLSPAALMIVQGATGNTTVTITRTNFTGAVTLSLGNAPAGVTGSFDPAAPTGTSSTLTVSVGAAVAPGVYNLTVGGTGTAGDRSTPLTLTVSAPVFAVVAPVSAGIAHTCGVTSSGAAYCWGNNTYGGLGNGTTTGSTTPIAVSGGLTFAAVSVGNEFTCGVTTSGAAYCWGENSYGELGNGTTPRTTTTLSPFAVASVLTVAAGGACPYFCTRGGPGEGRG